MSLLYIFTPISIIKCIFEIVIFSKSILLAIYPLSIIYLFLLLLASWNTQQYSTSMLLTSFELSTILQINFGKIINSIPLNPFVFPISDVCISISKSILSLLELSLFLLVINLLNAAYRSTNWVI